MRCLTIAPWRKSRPLPSPLMSRDLKACRSSGEMLLLKPALKKGAGLLTFGLMENCMEEGYLYTKQQMGRIKRVLGVRTAG